MPTPEITISQPVPPEWNECERPLPARCVHQLFEQWAAQEPGRSALRWADGRWTYGELNAGANRLAHHLLSLGVGRDVIVAVALPQSPEVVLCMLAVLKAGGVCMPIPDNEPADRVAFRLADTQARVLIRRGSDPAPAPVPGLQVLMLEDAAAWAACPTTDPAPAPAAALTDCALIFYTSGSTGKPKGVEVLHQGILRLVVNTNYVDFRPDDVVAQISNIGFDAATFEVWGALTSGAELAIIPSTTALRPTALAQALSDYGISVLFLTTSFFNLIAQEEPGMLAGVRYVSLGGEKADYASVRRVLDAGKPAQLVNGYGPTETTTFAICYDFPADLPRMANLPIGRPIANTRVYLVNEALQPVAVGEEGEILIGGPGVARGYLHRPELTAERFIPDPFRPGSGERMYRTGDLGRFLPDGTISFIGRRDNQVKIRGFRIELDEIELVLREHPAVKEAAVAVVDSPVDRKLVAFVHLSETPAPPLRDYLADRLPAYMVPAQIEVTGLLPRNANGKIDRAALLAGQSAAPASTAPGEPARDPLEQELLDLWRAVLGAGVRGVTDSFLELGGNSLLAARLVHRVEKRWGRSLPLATLMTHGSPRQFAALLRAGADAGEAPIWILLREGAVSLPPLFLFPGGGANLLYLGPLAACVAPERAIYGFKPLGEVAGRALRSVEAMAEAYAVAVRQLQPQGPYALLGHSTGGLVALETARLLRADGADVPFLGLLDTAPPGARVRQSLHKRLLFYRDNLRMRTTAGSRLAYAKRSWNVFLYQLSRLLARPAWLPWMRRLAPHLRGDLMLDLIATHGYNPAPYPGPATVFCVRERLPYLLDDAMPQWARVVPEGLKLVEVPGDHLSMLRPPHVEDLARAISRG